jgi:pyruvate/oxaloacetate carboxyltransferase
MVEKSGAGSKGLGCPPTSQIVGAQAVINMLTGERCKSITAGIRKGEYGAAHAPSYRAKKSRA